MLTHGLLRDTVRLMGDGKDHGKFRVTSMSPATIQRRVRVGFATASQLADALATAGVLGPAVRGRRPVNAYDLDAAYALIEEAIEDGRIEPDPEGQRQHWPNCTKFDRPVDGHELECGCWCHKQANTLTAPNPGAGRG